jgi:hypothetical protein
MSAGGIDNSMKLKLTDERQRKYGHESRNRLDVRFEVYGSFASPGSPLFLARSTNRFA